MSVNLSTYWVKEMPQLHQDGLIILNLEPHWQPASMPPLPNSICGHYLSIYWGEFQRPAHLAILLLGKIKDILYTIPVIQPGHL